MLSNSFEVNPNLHGSGVNLPAFHPDKTIYYEILIGELIANLDIARHVILEAIENDSIVHETVKAQMQWVLQETSLSRLTDIHPNCG